MTHYPSTPTLAPNAGRLYGCPTVDSEPDPASRPEVPAPSPAPLDEISPAGGTASKNTLGQDVRNSHSAIIVASAPGLPPGLRHVATRVAKIPATGLAWS